MTTKEGKKQVTEKNDVIIIGGGISAHTAALYTARAKLSPLVITGTDLDQLSTTTAVENYPGFPEGIQGPLLIELCKKQAERFGAAYISEDVTGISPLPGKTETGASGYKVMTSSQEYLTKTIVICTGASARTLGIPGEKQFWAKGVSTCAPCDAPFFKDKDVVVIGGGDSAMEESLMLTKFARLVTIIHRRDEFRASKIMQQRVLSMTDKVKIIWDTTITAIVGNTFVTGVKTKHLKTGKEVLLPCEGVFLAIGHDPNTKWLGKSIELDDHGYIKVHGVKTSLPGVFAAGDVMDPRYRQAVTSAGTGCMAALDAERYIELLHATQ
ncbi:thioredoxin-disulfide reductase [Candidatus Woesearchaeota archaeon]|nr:thioredoxin-disulfide reductase [Candidatus Woesearchaeota archaeon]